MKKPSELEGKVESRLVNAIRKQGGICYKLRIIGKRNFPDRTILLPGGYICFAECKRQGEDLQKGQNWLATKILGRLGFCVYRVITDDDILMLINDYIKWKNEHD